MTEERDTGRCDHARRALERPSRLASPPPNEPTDPELLARLDAAVRSLPRRRREIFLAVRIDRASYAALAKQTGLTVRQVEREVARALTQIDRALDDRRPERRWRRWFG